jgi:hypothetical protein
MVNIEINLKQPHNKFNFQINSIRLCDIYRSRHKNDEELQVQSEQDVLNREAIEQICYNLFNIAIFAIDDFFRAFICLRGSVHKGVVSQRKSTILFFRKTIFYHYFSLNLYLKNVMVFLDQ